MIYSNDGLKEIVFPLGGIGSGSIGLSGSGNLVDWEIFNRPDKGMFNGYSFFAINAEYPDGKKVTKVLQGDCTKDFMGRYSKTEYSGYGMGASKCGMYGLPHFKYVEFDGKFPIAKITFDDDDFPATVILRAFNPFIPLDSDNSSIPAAFFEVGVISKLDGVKYTLALSVANPFCDTMNKRVESDKYTAIKMYYYGKAETDKEYGDMTVAIDEKDGICQEYWYRGDWMDGLSTFWYELKNSQLKARSYDTAGVRNSFQAGRNDTGSVGCEMVLNKSQEKSCRFIISWNVPNNYNYWNPCKDENGNDVLWKNYYASLFKDSVDTALYSLEKWDSLYEKTKLFCDSLHNSTLDNAVIEAVSGAIAVLKSATVFRLEDGTFYGWEGLRENVGSCEGTCMHVWTYAYALCFLFPDLERSMRETEFRYNTDSYGGMYFRTLLPLGRGYFDVKPPCVDGQMGTIIKIYRDYKITGDTKWLKENWENIVRVLEYAWNENNQCEWDLNKDGVIEGRQHHTLDMELFGPSAWLQGMYLAALKAAAELAAVVGDIKRQNLYAEIFENGCRWTNDNLFNGEYFYHKVDLKDRETLEHFDCLNYWNEERSEMKYQIATGCGIDQMLGQWHADISGLGDIFDEEKRKIALKSMLKNNFKPNFRNVENMWRVFALDDESGTVICDYPEGVDKPIIPLPYSEECMSGFEYAFAGLLINNGFIDEGLSVIRAVRNRYDGKKRNPWSEIECGSSYARTMACFALLPIFSGFKFDLSKNYIGFAPRISGDFRCFWSLSTGFGNLIKNQSEYKIEILSGFLELTSVSFGESQKVKNLYIDGKKVAFGEENGMISFDKITVQKEILCEVSV